MSIDARATADTLTVKIADDPASPVLDRFYAGYDRAFVLPDEREDRDGFAACLALNPRRFGWLETPRREMVLTAEDVDGRLLGGANFVATHIADACGAPPVAIALNYLFVEPHARGRGLTRRLLQSVRAEAVGALGLRTDTAAAIFLEQNDPLRLTAEEYAADTAVAGIDQIDRLALWARLGARLVDIAYVQPALSPAQAPDDGLAYSVIGIDAPTLPPAYLAAHLTSFLGVSVLKGRDPREEPATRALLASLDRGDRIALLDPAPALERLRHDPTARRATSLRALAAGGER